jgi:hypothetical protein
MNSPQAFRVSGQLPATFVDYHESRQVSTLKTCLVAAALIPGVIAIHQGQTTLTIKVDDRARNAVEQIERVFGALNMRPAYIDGAGRLDRFESETWATFNLPGTQHLRPAYSW